MLGISTKNGHRKEIGVLTFRELALRQNGEGEVVVGGGGGGHPTSFSRLGKVRPCPRARG